MTKPKRRVPGPPTIQPGGYDQKSISVTREVIDAAEDLRHQLKLDSFSEVVRHCILEAHAGLVKRQVRLAKRSRRPAA